MAWNTIKSETVFQSPYVSVNKDIVKLTDGSFIDDFYTITAQDAAAVVALTDQNEIILEKVYRYACKETVIELPAGTFESGENDGFMVAKRELLEETGFASDDWTYLGATRECPARLTSRIHLFLARNCIKVAEQKLDIAEEINVFKIPFTKAIEMIMNNDILCNSTVHGIFKAGILLNGIKEYKES